MEGGRVGVLGPAVADHGNQDEPEHQQTNNGHNPQNSGMKVVDFLADAGDTGSQVFVGTFSPIAGHGHSADHQRSEADRRAVEQS